jgi:hypothetical protein
VGDKKSVSKKNDVTAAALTGRIASLKIAQDFCEFNIKGGKNGSRYFTVDSKGGLPLNAVIEALSAAWAGNRKITVQPMTGDAMGKSAASISLGKMPKSAKAEKLAKPEKPGKAEKPSKAEKPGKTEKPADAEKPVQSKTAEPAAA